MRAKHDPKAGKRCKGKDKVDVHDISITHRIDKSSPALFSPQLLSFTAVSRTQVATPSAAQALVIGSAFAGGGVAGPS
jgi:type VI protein secretion system component Hcp